MRRLLFTLSMLFGLTAQAAVEVFDYPNYRVYAIQDAATRFPASLFDSIDPEEKFVQTEADYAGSINVFIVEFKSDGRRIMIDAGLGSPRGKLLTEMKKAGLAPKSISDIFITHIHIDHVGGLPDFPHAKVHIAKDEYEAWAKDPSRKSLAKYLPDKKDLVLFDYDDGGIDLSHDLVGVDMPGHTPGHTVFELSDFGGPYFIGDLIHAADLQIAHPAFCARYDMDPKEAADVRRIALKGYRGEWFGAHIPFPGRYRDDAPPEAVSK